jgi:LPS-assembly protein
MWTGETHPMSLRTLRIITFTFVSHLLLISPAFTSQLPFASDGAAGAQATRWVSQEVTIKARQQSRQGNVYTLDGDVEILFENYVLRAEHASYNEATGDVEASGGVVFEGGPHEAHLTASRAAYNVKTEEASFYGVAGTFGARVGGRAVALTTSNPFVVAAREVHKIGRNRYIVSHGSITSCAEQVPRWTFNAEKIDLVAGEDAKVYHSSFRLMKVPLFYVPFSKLPATPNSRNTGFLLPTAGQSSTKGFILGESVYWAINRWNDVTVGAQYFSDRGWSQSVHARSRPGENTVLELRYFGVKDRGAPGTDQDQGGHNARLLGETTFDYWRASASLDYLSSFLFRQAFSESYAQAVNSEVRSEAYVSHNRNGFSLNAVAARYQNFFQNPVTLAFSEQVKILHLPMVEFNALEQPLPRVGFSRLRWALDSSAGGLQRSEPGFVTANLVGRLDIRPRVALPLEWQGWQLRPEVAVHDTLYTQQVQPSTTNPLGVASGEALNRRAVEASIELRPAAVERVFDRRVLGWQLKHVIEPVFTYNYIHGVGNFPNIIRFDQQDILSNTSEFEWDLVQRIYGRRGPGRKLVSPPGCEPTSGPPAFSEDRLPPAYIPGAAAVPPRCEPESPARELLTWEVKQKFYVNESFGRALVTGRRNVFASTIDLTGIAFLDEARTWSPVISTLRLQTSANTDVQWQLDYDPVRGRINSSATFLEYRLGEYFAGVSHSFFHELPNTITPAPSNAPLVFDQIRYLIGYGHPNKLGFSGGFSMGYDKNRDFLQYAAGQSTYNWDCCGVSFEFRHINVPGVNIENQYRFAFTLANIGTFGNLRRQERLY